MGMSIWMEKTTPLPMRQCLSHHRLSFCPKADLASHPRNIVGRIWPLLLHRHTRRGPTNSGLQDSAVFSSFKLGISLPLQKRYDPEHRQYPDPQPNPEPKPNPDPNNSPPIITLPRKRLPLQFPTRPANPAVSTTTPPLLPALPVHSTTSVNPYRHITKMGSKGSKIPEDKNESSTAKSDKEEMKEPSNYYKQRSKSTRKKAGRTPGAAKGGASGGADGGGGLS
ncbi:hypothetical protein P280DRAFT_465873 [Massarina eburnea CBS 473.64]|uniref:Uncharacterized protein n=1 Tax=Massarina eburnea CBS 473.64 TaxID=1395130 RepID=A0A6A6SAH9_9PLEO|nr:hypothetical protein P280DRAFT_465873 [Massarina eburnea CBS 473.64]